MSSRTPGRPGPRATRSAQEASRRAAEQAAQRRRDRNRLVLVVAVLVVALVGGGLGLQAWRTGRGPSAVPAGTYTDAPQPLTDGQPIRFGSASAPVELTVYEDFHCPHCADFEEEFGPVLDAARDAGQVRLAVWPMSFIDAGSGRAAAGMACATEAGFGERYYRGLFANAQLGWSEDQLLQLGALSTATVPAGFTACVRDGEQVGWADAVDAAAETAGVTGTPTLFLDGAPLPLQGLTPESLRNMIEAKS
ncbi:Protein-disulfide isomerase [Friedmanniella luteola]|uniref:Protein-disulfide isomerase n=1 Tax=Friedmanniella luteola TaxID=546871 RepID=A0A1H1URR7_9ACTN|nr:thioredoxin domain-containing protein [Friedmanniella luteola]SDS75274.1 Protein-disulfide isomerase [Friedmanniella luteola]